MSGNPLRWVCDRDGCFNRVKRPKIEVFSDCFEHGINFGDVDGLVERNGHFLLLEWKSVRKVPIGQQRLHSAILRDDRWTIVLVCGDPESMRVDSFEVRRKRGRQTGIGLPALKAKMRSWFLYAERTRT